MGAGQKTQERHDKTLQHTAAHLNVLQRSAAQIKANFSVAILGVSTIFFRAHPIWRPCDCCSNEGGGGGGPKKMYIIPKKRQISGFEYSSYFHIIREWISLIWTKKKSLLEGCQLCMGGTKRAMSNHRWSS